MTDEELIMFMEIKEIIHEASDSTLVLLGNMVKDELVRRQNDRTSPKDN